MNEALAHHRAGRLAEAETVYRAVLRDVPDHPDVLHLLGVAIGQRGDHRGGEALIRRAIALNPTASAYHVNLGKLVEERGDLAGAIASYRQALTLNPDHADAHFNCGAVLQAQGDYPAAETAYRAALRIAPAMYKAAHNLGVVLMGMGRPGEAAAAFRDVLAAKPDEADSHRSILQAILYDPSLDNAARFAEHQRFAARFGQQLQQRSFTNSRDPDRRLRVGWLSSDLRGHPVARNLESLFVSRDRAAADFVCYADVATPDSVTARFRGLADGWRDVHGLSDSAVADRIRADGIDLLVLLAGRFDRNRPLVAEYRPAPVQVSLFDGATSGLPSIDYLIADRILVPPRATEQFTERVVRLPSLYVYPPFDDAPPVQPLQAGGSSPVTFGSFNNPAKISEPVVELWGRVLGAVPDSRLLLKYQGRFGRLADGVRRVLARSGVDGHRVEVLGAATDQRAHLALYNRVDVALDPFPFSGSTTTFEALWMGVPVVTLAGASMAGRWSASMLHAVHLDDLVASDPADYVAKAVGLASDRSRRIDLRANLRARVAASPLCNGAARARQFDRVLRAVWRRWCRRG